MTHFFLFVEDDIREEQIESKRDLLARYAGLSDKSSGQEKTKAEILMHLSFHLKNNSTTISLPNGREFTRPQLLIEAISFDPENPRIYLELAKIYSIDVEIFLRDGTRLSFFDLLHRICDLDSALLITCSSLLNEKIEQCRIGLASDSGSLNFVDGFSGKPTERSSQLYLRAISEFPSDPTPLQYLLQLDYSRKYYKMMDGCHYSADQLALRCKQLGGRSSNVAFIDERQLLSAPFSVKSISFPDGRSMSQMDIAMQFSRIPAAAKETEYDFSIPADLSVADKTKDFTIFTKYFKEAPFVTADSRGVSKTSYLWLALSQVCGPSSGGIVTLLDGSKLHYKDLLALAVGVTHTTWLRLPAVPQHPNIEACLELAQHLITSRQEDVTISSKVIDVEYVMTNGTPPADIVKHFSPVQLLLDAIDQLQESQAAHPQPKRRNAVVKSLYRTAGLLLAPGAPEFSPRGSTFSRLELLAKGMRMHPYSGDDFSNVACELPTGLKVPIDSIRADHELLLRWGIEYQSSMACVNFVDFMEDRVELPERLELLCKAVEFDSANPIAWIRLFELLPGSKSVTLNGKPLRRDDVKIQALDKGRNFMADPIFPYALSYRQGDLSMKIFIRDELRRVLGVQ
jgi:hypothetical protein